MSKRPVQKSLFRVLTLCLVVCLLGGGIALIYQLEQGAAPGYASSESVVGEPTLTGAYVDTIFRRVGSPMVGTGKIVEAAAQKQHIDDAFALAVWWVETNDAAAGVGLADNNPGSVRGSVGYPEAYDGYTIYPTFTDAVNYWFSMMKKVYIDRGLTTVSAIAGPYVGTSTSGLWAGKVINLMQRYHSEAPPKPTPTPTVSHHITQQAVDTAKRDAPQAQTQPTRTEQTDATVTSPFARVTPLLVISVLLAGIVLAIWGQTKKRRLAKSKQLEALLEDDRPTRIRAGIQEATSSLSFLSATGNLRNTGSLARSFASAESATTTGHLFGDFAMSETLPPADAETRNTTGNLLPVGASLWGQMDFTQQPTSQPTSTFTGTQRPLSTPLPEAWPFERPPATVSAVSTGLPHTLHKTRLQPSRPEADQSSGNELQPVSAGLFGSPTSAAGNWPSPLQLIGTEEPQQLPFETPVRQPQPVGSGSTRSNGLLSRYREAQARHDQS